jgi:hypothetical protein
MAIEKKKNFIAKWTMNNEIWFLSSKKKDEERKITIRAFEHRNISYSIPISLLVGFGVYCHFQQYFSYILTISFIGGGNQM